jgi:hypothetical protein
MFGGNYKKQLQKFSSLFFGKKENTDFEKSYF